MKTACALLASTLLLGGACSRPGIEPEAAEVGEPFEDSGRPLPSPLPEVLARVNGQPVRFAQIVPLARNELEGLPEEDQVTGRPRAVRRALELYIDRELLFQEAQSRAVTVDDRQLEWAYDQARSEYPDDEEWEAFLAEEGLDPQSLKTEIRIQHTVSAFLEAEGEGFPVSDAEARAAFEENVGAFTPTGQAPPSYDEAREDVREFLRGLARDRLAERLLEDLRSGARIERFI